jgi:hypothetical protein
VVDGFDPIFVSGAGNIAGATSEGLVGASIFPNDNVGLVDGAESSFATVADGNDTLRSSVEPESLPLPNENIALLLDDSDASSFFPMVPVAGAFG